MTKTITDIFADLVALPTVSDNREANHEALEYIDHFLSERGLFVHRHEWNGSESLVATTQPTKNPRIMLAGHIDVVPAPPRLFKLEERDGKFYGRGVCDMKFAIAAYLQLVEDLQEDLRLYDFGIMITTDEEIGGRDGVKALMEDGYRAKAFVLPDGGDDWAMEQSAKGLVWLIATASGTNAHGSRPWEGENAIEKMMLFLQAVRRELFAAQDNDTSTINIGTIEGGSAVNQVPGVCVAHVDMRSLNREEHTRIISRIKELGEEYDVSCELKLNDSPIDIDMTDPYVAAYVESVEHAIGRPMQTMRSNGGSDARYIAAYDIPTLVAYPTGGGRHSNDEWLDVKSFYQFSDVLRNYLNTIARVSEAPALKKTEMVV